MYKEPSSLNAVTTFLDADCQLKWQEDYPENYCGLCREPLPGTQGRSEPVRDISFNGKSCGFTFASQERNVKQDVPFQRMTLLRKMRKTKRKMRTMILRHCNLCSRRPHYKLEKRLGRRC